LGVAIWNFGLHSPLRLEQSEDIAFYLTMETVFKTVPRQSLRVFFKDDSKSSFDYYQAKGTKNKALKAFTKMMEFVRFFVGKQWRSLLSTVWKISRYFYSCLRILKWNFFNCQVIILTTYNPNESYTLFHFCGNFHFKYEPRKKSRWRKNWVIRNPKEESQIISLK